MMTPMGSHNPMKPVVNIRPQRLFVWALAFLMFDLILLCGPLYGQSETRFVINPEMQPLLAELIEQSHSLPCDAKLQNIGIDKDHATLRFVFPQNRSAELAVQHPGKSGAVLWRGKRIALVGKDLPALCPELVDAMLGAFTRLDERWKWETVTETRKPDAPPVLEQRTQKAETDWFPDIPLAVPAAILWLLWFMIGLYLIIHAFFISARKDILIAGGLFLLAVLIRFFMVDAGMSTIHSNSFIPGLNVDPRFGPGSQVLEAGVYLIGGANSGTVFITYILFGSLLIPITYSLVRPLDSGRTLAFATALFLSVLPLHVLASASDAEHVLAVTLCGAGIWAWRQTERGPIAVIMTLFSLISLILMTAVRVDSFIYVFALLMWSWIDRPVRYGGVGRWLLFALVFGGATLLCLWKYGSIITNNIDVMQYGFPVQMLLLYRDEIYPDIPMWFPELLRIFYWLGGVLLVLRNRKRGVLLIALIFYLLVPAVVGCFGSNLMESRYFLIAAPFQVLLAAYGLLICIEWIRRIAHLKWLRAPVVMGICLLIAAATVWMEWRLFEGRQAYQEEYHFLSEALDELPEDSKVLVVDNMFPVCEDVLVVNRSLLRLDYPYMVWLYDPAEIEGLKMSEYLVYYKRASCSYTAEACGGYNYKHFKPAFQTARKECREIETEFELEPVAEYQATVMSRYGLSPRDDISLGLYEISP